MFRKIKGDDQAHRKYKCRKEIAQGLKGVNNPKAKRSKGDDLESLREEVKQLRAIVEILIEP